MTRICVLGDSHLGMVKRAMADLPKESGIEVTYFGARVDLWTGLSVRGREVSSSDQPLTEKFYLSSGGKTSIRVDEYDCFLIVGLDLSILPFAFLSIRFASDSMQADSKKIRLSDACFSAAGYGILKTKVAVQVLGHLRSLSNRPIFLIPAPNPAEGASAEILPPWLQPYYVIGRSADAWAIRNHFKAACAQLERDFESIVVDLPEQAAATGLINHQDYSRLARNAGNYTEEEIIGRVNHANVRYAQLVLPTVLEAMGHSITFIPNMESEF